ncbi:MAG: SEC-C domain-containing protein [Desulfovibrio sp.]|nr:SEC-C domain-containing protein [Desulfovibrio sp.]
MKLGRNDLCWCGSGIKYKKCHLNRVNEDVVGMQDVINVLNIMNKRKMCLHPQPNGECDKIIQSHTVQKNGSLSKISEDGKVYYVRKDYPDLVKNEGEIGLKLVGVSSASTFFGFCKKHDQDFFLKIENKNFEKCYEDVFRLHYRSMCKQYYDKMVAIESQKEQLKMIDRGMNANLQRNVQMFLNMYIAGNEQDLIDMEFFMNEACEVYKTGAFEKYSYCVFEFLRIPSVMACSAFAMSVDAFGDVVQSTLSGVLRIVAGRLERISSPEKKFPLLCVNVFANDDKGIALFSWDKGADEVYRKCFEKLSLANSAQVTEMIVRMLCAYTDNFVVEPKWWNSLDEEGKAFFLKIAHPSFEHGSEFAYDYSRMYFGDWGLIGSSFDKN